MAQLEEVIAGEVSTDVDPPRRIMGPYPVLDALDAEVCGIERELTSAPLALDAFLQSAERRMAERSNELDQLPTSLDLAEDKEERLDRLITVVDRIVAFGQTRRTLSRTHSRAIKAEQEKDKQAEIAGNYLQQLSKSQADLRSQSASLEILKHVERDKNRLAKSAGEYLRQLEQAKQEKVAQAKSAGENLRKFEQAERERDAHAESAGEYLRQLEEAERERDAHAESVRDYSQRLEEAEQERNAQSRLADELLQHNQTLTTQLHEAQAVNTVRNPDEPSPKRKRSLRPQTQPKSFNSDVMTADNTQSPTPPSASLATQAKLAESKSRTKSGPNPVKTKAVLLSLLSAMPVMLSIPVNDDPSAVHEHLPSGAILDPTNNERLLQIIAKLCGDQLGSDKKRKKAGYFIDRPEATGCFSNVIIRGDGAEEKTRFYPRNSPKACKNCVNVKRLCFAVIDGNRVLFPLPDKDRTACSQLNSWIQDASAM